MNGKLLGGKPLYVALAQRKDERKNILAMHYAQRMQNMGMRMGAQGQMPGGMYQGPGGYMVGMPGVQVGLPRAWLPSPRPDLSLSPALWLLLARDSLLMFFFL